MRKVKLMLPREGKFRFGNYKSQVTNTLSSDRVFSALVNNLSIIDSSQIDTFIEKINNNSIRISSLMIGMNFSNDSIEKEIFFYPMPLMTVEVQDLRKRKIVKRIKYISIKSFKTLNYDFENQKISLDLNKYHILGDEFLILKSELVDFKIKTSNFENIKPFNKAHKDGNLINRFTNESEEIYSIDYYEHHELQFNQTSIKPFFYFYIDGEVDEYILGAIRFIKDQGLGGKRNIGFGSMREIIVEDIEREDLSNYNTLMLIGTMIPQNSTDMQAIKSYLLTKRGGYIYSSGGQSIKKNDIYMFVEGSILDKKVRGALVNVTPNAFEAHEIYINGKGFLIGIGVDQS